jgi:Uma2 family endonuclease
MVETRPKLTEEKFMALPDDGHKYELVDGEAKEVPTGFMHGRLAMIIAMLLGPIAQRIGALADSSTGFRMKGGNVRVPDVSFVRAGRVPRGPDADRFFDGAPDLAIEIISESEDRSDAARKIVEYFESGAQQVWTVQPLTQSVTVYKSLDNVRTYDAHEELTGGDLLPGFSCVVTDVFATD